MIDAVEDDSISLLDLVTVLGEEKGLFLGIPALAVIIAIAVSLWLTPLYTAKAVFVIPDKATSGASALLDQFGGAASLLGGAAGLKSSGAMYAAMMESTTVREALAQRFKLQERYHQKNGDDTLKAMKKYIKVSNDAKTGLISVEVEDEVPQFAADLANAHLEEMRKLLNRMSANEADQRREFFEKQVDTLAHRPFRDPMVQTSLMSSLIRQYEQARLDEAHDSLVLQEVDLAHAPERKSSPKRALIVLGAGFGGLFLGALLAFMRHAVRRSRTDPESQASWNALSRAWGWRRH